MESESYLVAWQGNHRRWMPIVVVITLPMIYLSHKDSIEKENSLKPCGYRSTWLRDQDYCICKCKKIGYDDYTCLCSIGVKERNAVTQLNGYKSDMFFILAVLTAL